MRFAELMARDPHAMDDGLFGELRGHFAEAEIVELGVHAALCLGLGRLNVILGVDPA